jgi:hypothetical protein
VRQRRDSKTGIKLFFFEKETKVISLEQDFCTPQNSIRVEFICDRLSIVPRGSCCNITGQNAHAPTEEKSDKAKDSFYEELQRILHHLPK